MSTILEKSFFFIINILIARYLSKEHFGEYSAALAFGTFFGVFANMGVGISSIRAINYHKEDENENYTSTIILKTVLSLGTFVIITVALFFTHFNRNTVILALILGLVRILNEFLLTVNQLFEAKSKFLFSSIYNSMFAFLFMGGTYIVILCGGNYFALSFNRLAIIFAVIVFALFHVHRYYKFSFDFAKFRRFCRDTVSFSYSIVFNSVTMNFAAIILPVFHGTVYSGIYNNAYIFFLTVMFIPSNLSRVLMPFLYRNRIHENKELFTYSYSIYMKIFSIMSFYIAIVFFLFADKIILMVFGTKYADSIHLLKIFAFAIPFVFNIASSIIATINRQIINSKIEICVATCNVILSIILIKYYKATGAVICSVITSVLLYCFTNGYLLINKYISYTKTAMVRMKLLVISVSLCVADLLLLKDINFMISFLIVTILFTAFLFAAIINKEDLNLIKTVIRGKKSLGK
jgi:teichuronic acid exporter